jgi:hypothetical protein
MKLLRFPCLWLVAACALNVTVAAVPKSAVDPKTGWEVALLELTLPYDSAAVHYYGRQGRDKEWKRVFKPQAGDTKFGYTWFDYGNSNKWSDGHPGNSGWHRLVEKGETRVWYDRKSDRQRQPEEIATVPYRLWFAVRMSIYPLAIGETKTLEDIPKADGSCPPALRYAEQNVLRNFKTAPEAVPGLGDHAWLVADGTGSNGWLNLVVVRGPAVLRYEIHPSVMLRSGEEFADDPILRNVRGGALSGDLRTFAPAPDSSSGYLDVAGMAPRVEQLMREEVLGLAREFVGNWDRYCAAKVGPGPVFKGLFFDTGALLPAAADLPGTKETQSRREMWTSSLSLSNAAKDNVETLQLDLRMFYPQTNAPTADQAMLDAAAEFDDSVAQRAKYPDQRPVLLQVEGVDQCAAFEMSQDQNGRRLYTTRMLHFRYGNVYGHALHYRLNIQMENEKIRPLPGDPLVKLVLATLAKMKQVGGGAPAAKAQESAGPSTLAASAANDRLWSDGASATTLRFEAKLADGRPAAGMPLKLEVASPFVGDVAATELTTDQNGVATVEYRAGARPGANTVTAVGGGGLTAAVAFRHGGLETVVRSEGLQFLADGATPVVVAARLLDPDGKPLAKAVIAAEPDESEIPGRGEFVREVDRDEAAAGWQIWTYTPPKVDPAEGWKGGRVELRFAAKPPGAAGELASPLAITLHSGSPFWCLIEKPGFAPGARTSFRSERSHGMLNGTAQAASEAGAVPLVGAKVTVYAAVGGKEQVIGSGASGPGGAFAVPFTVEKTVTGPEGACALEPAALVLDPETERWLGIVRTKAAALRAKGFASKSAEGFAAKFAADLAAAPDDPQNPRNPARLVVAVRLMGETLGYLDELDDQHTQAEGWLNESLEAAVDDLTKVIDLGSRVEAAQDAATEYATTAPELAKAREKARIAWNSLRKKAVARFVTTAYGVIRDTYKDASDELETREKLGLSNETGTVAWKKWAVNRANDYYAEWMFAPADAISNWGEAKLKAELTKFLKNAYRGQYPKFFAAALEHAAGRIARGEATWGDPEKAAAVLRDDFAAVAETYRKANEAHLNRELARLDFKLAVDTVGKGAAIYFAAKETLKSNPAEAKEKILESIDQVDKAFAAVDTACQTYNGRQWFAVCHRARLAIADVAVDGAR